MNNNTEESPIMYATLELRFEHRLATRSFTFLGQAVWSGCVDALLAGYPCAKPVEFLPEKVRLDELWPEEDLIDGEKDINDIWQEFLSTSSATVWFCAHRGFKTFRSICAALGGPGVDSTGLRGIVKDLRLEAEEATELLARAASQNIGFNLRLEEIDEPPPRLRDWAEQNFADTVRFVRDAMEEAGINMEEV